MRVRVILHDPWNNTWIGASCIRMNGATVHQAFRLCNGDMVFIMNVSAVVRTA